MVGRLVGLKLSARRSSKARLDCLRCRRHKTEPWVRSHSDLEEAPAFVDDNRFLESVEYPLR